ncbi:MAG: hypothetical protein OXH49_04500 [Gemmatimonadetes bacterium]|nr:hypothetical protein [Gemmatimonadota bacterium]
MWTSQLKHVGTNPRTRLSAILVSGTALVSLGALVWVVVVATNVTRSPSSPQQSSRDHPPSLVRPPATATLLPSVASVQDADLHDRIWFILDRANSQVHRLTAQGTYLDSFGGDGDGPGEFRSGKLIVAHADTIIVATRRRLHLYRSDGTGLGSRRTEPPQECAVPSLADIASTSAGLLLAYGCDPRERFAGLVVLEVAEGSYRRLAERLARSGNDRAWGPFDEGVVVAEHPHGFLFGHPNDECLNVLDLTGQVVDRVCHEWIERQPAPHPVGEEWNELAALARATGMSLEVPERYPPFDKVFVRRDAGPVYRAPATESVGVFRLLARDSDVFDSVPSASTLFMAEGIVLAAWYDLAGTHIMVYDAVDS